MDSFAYIRAFLVGIRRRLRRVAAARAALWAIGGMACALLIGPLLAASTGWSLIAKAVVVVCAALVVGAAAFGFVVPRRRFRHDPEVARWVGRRAPDVASDLLSAVELEPQLSAGPRFSPELVVALADDTARRVVSLDPRRIVPGRPLRRPAIFTLTALLGHAVLALLIPSTIALGWKRMLEPPPEARRLGGAVPVAAPLVGDITLTLEYPAHMRRPPAIMPASSGDIVAPRGTTVSVTTTALEDATAAKIVFEGADDVPMRVDGRKLHGQFTVDKAVAYRFHLTPARGEPRVEAEPHRIEIETDRAPRVELIAPADELDVSSRRRIELGYSVEDDYGIGEIALVWKEQGGKEERKILPAPRPGSRTAQSKFLWDLSEVTLSPGSRVAYRLEAKDNDTLHGPHVGTSRTYHLRVFSARERHEEIVQRQQELLEMVLAALADRLELEPTLAQAAGREERLIDELATLIALVDEDKLSPKGLAGELKAMRGRMEKLRRENAPTKKWVPELERDAILLDDWIGRQRLEDLLAISDEIRQHREKLKDLLERYAKTRSAELRAEIEREIRAVEQRIAELQRKAAQLSGELADRFVNQDAIPEEESVDCMAEVRRLVDANKIEEAAKKLEVCTKMLEGQAEGLEQGLRELRGEKFSEEEKALSELMDEIGDLEREQSDVASKADDLMDQYKQRAAEATRDRVGPKVEKARKLLDKVKKELEGTPEGSLTPFSQEETEAIRRRLDDVGRMLDEGDVAEAQSMARQAAEGLKVVESDLEDDLADGEGWSDRTDEALDKVGNAGELTEELVDELEKATPSPEELMTEADRRQLGELRRRQREIRERTRRLGQKAEKRAGQLPGQAGATAKKGLDEAAQQMERGEGRMEARDPMGAREEARGAAEKLSKLRQGMQRSSRPTSVGTGRNPDDEPVRIPGSEEYRAPEAWREDILEGARKGAAPKEYREQVERYFQELIK